MVLPTYLGIKEAAKRIQQKCREPVTQEWLLQHASEGRLQLFALLRENACVLKPGIKIDLTTLGTLGALDKAMMSAKKIHEATPIAEKAGTYIHMSDELARTMLVKKSVSSISVTFKGKQKPAVDRRFVYINETDGSVCALPGFSIKMDDLCFLSVDIEHLIDANSSAAATHAKQSTSSTKTTATETKVGADDTAARKEAGPKREAGEPFLQPKSKNSRAAVDQWVKWQAYQLVKTADTTSELAKRIWALADRWKYESERGPMTIPSITKMLPPGLTGGRGKNKGIKAKK
jgi:hypothetical protein